MRIGIDCRLGGSAHAGIGRYIEELVLRLPKLNKKITWVLFSPKNKPIVLVLKTAKLSSPPSNTTL